MNDYQDDPTKYIPDQTVLGQAMHRARMAEQAANQAKQDALAVEAKERAKQEEIERAVELSVQNNAQLQAQRMGFSPNRLVSSQSIGMIAPPEVVASTPVRFNGIEISGQQARDMVTYGQWDAASHQKALAEALARHGYKAPGSFQKAR
ncbi:hypothetical protein [Mesorhizobium sp.]|uniref:hypothetical protein n=1 Tax=Mesorhizobium sp. TaxID=1871066 RepID=UPI000FE8145B|nr:hypothetical protein [Mesorhizobium sp.]RWQ52764.1 MAG: hypothetical protein EOS83_20140 [Mesorhizobium sp.]